MAHVSAIMWCLCNWIDCEALAKTESNFICECCWKKYLFRWLKLLHEKKNVESQAKINQFIFHRHVWHSRGKNGEMKKRETRRFLNVKMPFTSILSEKTLRKVEEKEILSCLATFDLRAWERDNRWCQTSLMSRGLKIHPNVLLLRLVNLLKCHKRHDNTNQENPGYVFRISVSYRKR